MELPEAANNNFNESRRFTGRISFFNTDYPNCTAPEQFRRPDLLLYPKGDLSRAILNAAEESTGTVKDRARQYREQAQDFVSRGRDYVSQQKDQIRSAFEAGRQAYQEATSTPEPEGGVPKA